MAVIDKSVDRQKLDRRDPQRLDIVDHLFLAETGKGSPQILGHLGMLLRESLEMNFVDDRIIPGNTFVASGFSPLETGVNHDTLRHERSTVPFIKSEIVRRFHLVAEQGRVPNEFPGMTISVRIEQE